MVVLYRMQVLNERFRPFVRVAIASRLEAIATRLEAIAIGLEAVASRLEAIASRLEAVAIRLEAVALRLEAIAKSQLQAPVRKSRLWKHTLLLPPPPARAREKVLVAFSFNSN